MAAGTFYLRPSADISLGHKVYPSTMTAGYLAISEEVSDATATYIYIETDTKNTNPSSVSATSKFLLTLNADIKVKKITSAKFACAPYTSVTDSNSELELQCSVSIDGQVAFSGRVYKDSSGGRDESTLENIDTSSFVTAVNEYLAGSGGTLPEIVLTVYSSVYASGTSNSAESGITQAYIELECEYQTGLNIHKKINGVWVQIQSAYQKQSGAWVEITEDEAKFTLQNSFCTK